MCGCPLHDNRNGVDVCTCLCQEHDQFFEHGVVLVRQAVRRQHTQIFDLQQDTGQAMTAIKENAEDHNKRMAGIENLLSRLASADPDFVRGIAAGLDRSIHDLDRRLTVIENALPGIYTRLGGVEDESMSVRERLSPPDTASLSDMSIRAMEEKARTKDLPPDMWDRYGVRWTCKGRAPVPGRNTDDYLWEAVVPAHKGGERIAQMLGENLDALRGPFTSKSSLAEDQPSERERMIEKIAEAMASAVIAPGRGGTTVVGRSHIGGLAEIAYDTMNADRDVTSPESDDEDDEDDEDGEWVNLHAFVPGTASPEKCDACGGPADGLLHEQPRGSGLWSEPWEPQAGDEPPTLTEAIYQAVGAASACWKNLEGAGVFDDQRAVWVASGLQRWIEKRYQLFDQPAYQTYQSAEFDHLPKSERGRARRRSESGGDLLARLGTDAVKWAEDFVRSVSAHDDDYEVDQVLTWFANAIEAGRSAGQVDENGVDWKMRATAAETELALAREDTTHVANADRIRLAKDALMSSGYFDEGQVDDDIAPRIRELIDAHNTGYRETMDLKDQQIRKWKDRAVVAERRMSSVRQFVQDNLRVTQEEE